MAAYLASHARRACFCTSSLACLAARFSFKVRLGFFGWLDGVDLLPITSRYGRREWPTQGWDGRLRLLRHRRLEGRGWKRSIDDGFGDVGE